MHPRPPLGAPLALLVVSLATSACATRSDAPATATRDSVVVFAAASLSGPLRALRDSFARREHALVTEEHGASLELARRATDLERVPDVIALADPEVFDELLVPSATRWYARFARNRMVVAYTPRSRHAGEITPENWYRVVLLDDVLVGRTDPELAPAGYRALLAFALAESFYHAPGLAVRLAERSPPRLQRANAAELAALLQAGEVDYIVEYESLARSHGFRWVTLPAEVDLGEPAQAPRYAMAAVRVPRGRDSVTRRGAPILYGVSVPRRAPHPGAGARFVAFLLSAEGRAMLRSANVDALERPEIVGDSVPAVVRAALSPPR